MMTTTMYPEEMNQPANPWAGGMSPSQGPMGYGGGLTPQTPGYRVPSQYYGGGGGMRGGYNPQGGNPYDYANINRGGGY